MPTFNTIADLQAAVPEPATTVVVLGQNAVGDGGGGLFTYSNGAEATDGATVFAHDGDIGGELSDVISRTAINGFAAGANVAWGTVGLDIDNTVPVTLTDVHLHGHATDANTTNPLTGGAGRLDYKTGIFADRSNHIQNNTGIAGGSNITVRRKLIGNSRRWVRVVDDVDVFHLRWIGAQEGTTDSGHLLCWALNIAEREGYRILDMDGLDVVQSGMIEVPVNFTLQHGKITTRGSDWAALQLRTTPAYDLSDPEWTVDQMTPWIGGANSTDTSGVKITIVDIELDGNLAGNQDALNNPSNYAQLENTLQNAPYWCGWSWMNQNGRSVPANSFCNIHDSHFHDFGSNCLLGYFPTVYRTSNLRLGNCARNHLWYSVNGSHTGMYLYGFAWGTYAKSEGVEITNCIIENLVPNPYFQSAPIVWHYEGDDWGDGSLREPSRFDFRPGGFWKNVTVKLPDTVNIGTVFGVLGQGFHFSDLTVISGTGATATIFGEVGNGNQTGLNRNVTVDNCTVILRCGPNFSIILMSDMFADHVSVNNCTFHVRRGFSPPDKGTDPQGEYLKLQIPDTTLRVDPSFKFTRTAALREFAYTAEYGTGPVRLSDILDLTTQPVRFIVENGIARINSCNFVTTLGSTGDTNSWTNNNPEKFEGYWRNVFFDCEAFSGTNMRAFLFTAKEFENVTFQWTTVVTQVLSSEEVIEIDQDFTGQTVVDIPTDLFWVPKRLANLTIVAKNAAAGVVFADVAFGFRDRGNTVDIEWDDLATDGTVDYRAPILRLTVPDPIPAGNVQLEISLRVV